MRQSIFGILGLAAVGFATFCVAAAPDQRAISSKRDGELRRLLKGRFDAASSEVIARKNLYPAGRVALDDVCDALERFASAGADFIEAPADRVQHLQDVWEIARFIEDTVRVKHQNGVEPAQAVDRATFARYDMEIRLHLAKKAAGI